MWHIMRKIFTIVRNDDDHDDYDDEGDDEYDDDHDGQVMLAPQCLFLPYWHFLWPVKVGQGHSMMVMRMHNDHHHHHCDSDEDAYDDDNDAQR